VTKRNQTCKWLTVVTVVNFAGNMTASMCTNYYGGGMNYESYTRCHVYIILSCCTYIHFIVRKTGDKTQPDM